MDKQTLFVEIFLDDQLTKADLKLRHILVETIEDRNIGDIIEETSSDEKLEVVIEVLDCSRIYLELNDLLSIIGYHYEG